MTKPKSISRERYAFDRAAIQALASGRSFHHHALVWLAAGGGRPKAS